MLIYNDVIVISLKNCCIVLLFECIDKTWHFVLLGNRMQAWRNFGAKLQLKPVQFILFAQLNSMLTFETIIIMKLLVNAIEEKPIETSSNYCLKFKLNSSLRIAFLDQHFPKQKTINTNTMPSIPCLNMKDTNTKSELNHQSHQISASVLFIHSPCRSGVCYSLLGSGSYR